VHAKTILRNVSIYAQKVGKCTQKRFKGILVFMPRRLAYAHKNDFKELWYLCQESWQVHAKTILRNFGTYAQKVDMCTQKRFKGILVFMPRRLAYAHKNDFKELWYLCQESWQVHAKTILRNFGTYAQKVDMCTQKRFKGILVFMPRRLAYAHKNDFKELW
jgi:transcription elongation factor Elf1